LFAFVVLGLVFSVLSQEIGWEEYLRTWIFPVLCRVGRKTLTQLLAIQILIYYVIFVIVICLKFENS